jgi:hypothetical protein
VDEFSTPWHGILGQEGMKTGDGRYLAPGSTDLAALSLPRPMSAVLGPDQGHGHAGAMVVGTIDTMERRPNPDHEGVMDIWATGRFTGMAGAFAAQLAQQAAADGRRGYDVSFDLDRVSYEIRLSREYAEQTIEEIQEMIAMFEGEYSPPSKPSDLGDENADGSITVYEEKAGGVYFVVTSSEVRSATLVRIGAMSHGWVALGPGPVFVEVPAEADDESEDEMALAASSSWQPRSSWFDDPRLEGFTPTTITDEGRIYGTLALAGSCHTSFKRKCVTPPKSSTAYKHFHKGTVVTAEGERRAVGALVLGGSHAPLHLNADEVRKWHDDASTMVAAVRVGEDGQGNIWFSGALMPDVTDAQIARLRAAGVSGHWNGQELTIIHTVNSRGFGGEVEDRVVARALAASGMPTAFVSEPLYYSPEEALAAGCGCSCGTTDAAAEPVEATVEEPVEETTEDLAADPTETDSTPGSGSDPTDDPEALAQLAALRNLMGV